MKGKRLWSSKAYNQQIIVWMEAYQQFIMPETGQSCVFKYQYFFCIVATYNMSDLIVCYIPQTFPVKLVYA